jgi:hypothetical protein
MVNDIDPPFSDAVCPTPTGPDASQNQQSQKEQLQIQKKVLAKLLPNAVDVQVFDRTLPKHRAGHERLLSFELQKIQTQNRRWDRKKQSPLKR